MALVIKRSRMRPEKLPNRTDSTGPIWLGVQGGGDFDIGKFPPIRPLGQNWIGELVLEGERISNQSFRRIERGVGSIPSSYCTGIDVIHLGFVHPYITKDFSPDLKVFTNWSPVLSPVPLFGSILGRSVEFIPGVGQRAARREALLLLPQVLQPL